MARNPDNRAAPAWLRPPGEQVGLRYLGEVLREQRRIAIAILLVTLAAAAAYLLTADSVYEAEAELLVTPVPAEDPLVASLGLLQPRATPHGTSRLFRHSPRTWPSQIECARNWNWTRVRSTCSRPSPPNQ